MTLAELVRESDALHAAVRAFARGAPESPDFDALALRIARFQARRSPRLARLAELAGRPIDGADAIPAVPADAFRLTRVAVHPPELDEAVFATSGTTASERGTHALRTTETYRELALLGGRAALFSGAPSHTVIAVAPALADPPASSLGFMIGAFMQAFDGRGLDGAAFELRSRDRWLLGADGVDLAGFDRAVAVARERAEPLAVLATSLALAALVEALGGARRELPPGSFVMQTGGSKGQKRAVDPAALRESAARALGLPEASVVSEYGMTELSSQLYEATLPGASRGGEPGVLFPPRWLRVTPVDPSTLEPVPRGAPGLARFVDLGNVDSAVAIVTRDRIRRRGGGIELLGREPGAPPRGCSLAVEALLDGSADGA